ncbi:MAG: CPBP family intramembrane glutamic endopeptidase [Candidatus Methylomirabilales bacterium]
MRPGPRLCLLAASVVLGSALIAPLVKLFLDFTVTQWPPLGNLLHIQDEVYNFGRVFRRILLAGSLLALWLGRRWVPLAPLRSMELAPPGRAIREFVIGFGLGATSFTLLLFAIALVDHRPVTIHLGAEVVGRLGKAFGTAVTVGILEEFLFRGLLLQTLLLRYRVATALVASSLAYALPHFFRGQLPVIAGFDPGIGFRALSAVVVTPLLETDPILLTSLTLVGVTLGCARLWRRSLSLAMGIHAGWVFLIKIGGPLLGWEGYAWLYGETGLLGGPGGWVALGVMLLLFRMILRPADASTPARGGSGS